MYGCMSWNIKKAESWTIDAFQTVVLEKSPLDSKEIKPVNPKGNQPQIFIGRTEAEAETPILWPPDMESQLIGKDSDAGKDWRWEEKGTIRGWDGWMASPTQWTWVWAKSERWWRTGKPGILQSMGSQRLMHNWETEQQQWLDRGIFICLEIVSFPVFAKRFYVHVEGTSSVFRQAADNFFTLHLGTAWRSVRGESLGLSQVSSEHARSSGYEHSSVHAWTPLESSEYVEAFESLYGHLIL